MATGTDSASTLGEAGGKTLCLNMIVRNERANLERCLAAVADHIGCWVICDTGSSDGTQDFIRDFFSRRGIPGDLHEVPFENFEQARNAALDRASASRLEYDYLLLVDADMELVVDDPHFRRKLSAPSYLLIQRAGITYWNARLVRRDARARYRGVTHEYLDVAEGTERLEGAWFIDHASGANRVNKFERDIQLLLKGLEGAPDNTRYWFYLAQSYRDAGRPREAAETYARRAEMGGWDEEVWSSRLQEARCLRELGDEGGFLRAALQAYALRPQRAETLHDLARHYRQRSQNAAALLFSEPGCKLPAPPGDILFIESWIYEYGLLDEFAVSAYWVGRYRESLEVCERLLAEGRVPAHERERITRNAQFARDRIAEQTGAAGEPNAAEPAAGGTKTLPAGFSRFVRPHWVPPAETGWTPEAPAAGTELMVSGLKERLGGAFDRINLRVNHPGSDGDRRPRVVWMHHDVDQSWVQWCAEAKLVETVDRFVFVSEWQRDRYLAKFGLPAERCVVLRNATEINPEARRWEAAPVWRCAYTSTPFRGLSVLLDAWERLKPANAELHVWSSMKLYLQDDTPYRHLYERAQSLPGVTYHGIVPNAELRAELRRMHFLVYPSTFAETSCLAVIEALAAGCRVIVPSLGALPETTAEFARVYPWTPDADEHAKRFADVVASELADPWLGRTELSQAQQQYCATAYDWKARVQEWQRLTDTLLHDRPTTVRSPAVVGQSGPVAAPSITFYGRGEAKFEGLLSRFCRSFEEHQQNPTALCRAMTAEGSDKGGRWHNYTLLYDFLFNARKNAVRHVFEVGIGTNNTDVTSNMGASGRPGASLRAWRTYFPAAQIFGGDIDRRVLFTEPKISTFYVDQLQAEAITQLWDRLANIDFDLIIDDGLHTLEANANFLVNSHHKLNSQGLFIIEDILVRDLNRYHLFLKEQEVDGFIITLPHSINVFDNCLAVLASRSAQ